MKRQQEKCKSFIPGVDRDNLSLSVAKSKLGSLRSSEAESISQDESPTCRGGREAPVTAAAPSPGASTISASQTAPSPRHCLRQFPRDCSVRVFRVFFVH